ncbi:MAG: peptidoglycan DD-metalloendopeptidase family protein [Gammaproteobacteria bacterium]|nr:peptidoglycan DD-metalloendopeptidase family protein [Gammaproteobacteria bacterium]
MMHSGLGKLIIALSVTGLCGAGFMSPAFADKAKQLAELREKITSLRQALESDRSEQGKLLKRLADSERSVGRLNTDLRKTRQRQFELENELRALGRDRHQQQQSLRADKATLADQLVASYAMSRQGHLKLLLADRNPSEIGRTLAYYDYLNRARSERIQQLDQRLQALATIEKQLDARRDDLAQTKISQERSGQALSKEQVQRKQLIAALTNAIDGKEIELARLSEDEKALQQLLGEIERSLSDIPPEIDGGEPFAKGKGKLTWPVSGKLITRFGSLRGVGQQKWQGIEIAADAGTKVQAVSSGRVAFADWLRGFGLLIIVDHGEGYMTLYGRNQSLYHEVGDWVSAGDVIAGVGNSGGASESALYFEVRHKGKPQNPLKWVTAQR